MNLNPFRCPHRTRAGRRIMNALAAFALAMFFACVFLTASGLLSGPRPTTHVYAADSPPAPPAPTATPFKHTLPTGWSTKLQLTKEQKNAMYTVQDKYGPRIAAAQKALDDLKSEQLAALAALLTDAQRDALTARTFGKPTVTTPTPPAAPMPTKKD